MVLLFAMENDRDFFDYQQPDQDDNSMDNSGGVRYRQPDQIDPFTAIRTEVIRWYTEDRGFRSPFDADDTVATYSDYIYVFDDDRRRISRHRRPTFPAADDYAVEDDEDEYEEEYPFPVQAAPPGAASEAVIAALEAAAAPADDCCPVCLQEEDGGGCAGWRRVAPCGHRFHAACVAQWLRVKLSCPVCRRPADACRRDDALPAIVEEMLASEDEPRGLRRVRQRNSARWAQLMATYNAHSTGIDR